MLTECIVDFVKKYKKYIIVVCIVFAIIFLWKLTNRQENAEGTSSGSLGGMLLYCCGTIICGCILPFCIMYFITKSAAKAAIESTPCRTITPV
jgi:hypothetical protein